MATTSQRSLAQGGVERSRSGVEGAARHRLYRATADQHFVLSSTDGRLPVQIG